MAHKGVGEGGTRDVREETRRDAGDGGPVEPEPLPLRASPEPNSGVDEVHVVHIVLRLVPAGEAVLPVGPDDGEREAPRRRPAHGACEVGTAAPSPPATSAPPVLAPRPASSPVGRPRRDDVTAPVTRLPRRLLCILGPGATPRPPDVATTHAPRASRGYPNPLSHAGAAGPRPNLETHDPFIARNSWPAGASSL